MAKIRAGDLEVGFTLEGEASAPVVVLAHGVMTSRRMWDEVAALLAPRWRVLRHDLRGHGETTLTTSTEGPTTMAQLADDAVALLDALGLDRVHFIGSSLGGMIGQQLGARHGERLATLTLANTTAVQDARAAWAERIATAEAHGMAPLVEPTLRRWFTDALLAQQPPLLQRMRAIAEATPVRGFVAAAGAIRDLDQAGILADIATPTLVVAGRDDHATPLAQSQALVAAIAGARLEVLPAAHQAAAERPHEFVGLWEAFVDSTHAPDMRGPARGRPVPST